MISRRDCVPCISSLKVWKHKYLPTTWNKNNIVNERGSGGGIGSILRKQNKRREKQV